MTRRTSLEVTENVKFKYHLQEVSRSINLAALPRRVKSCDKRRG